METRVLNYFLKIAQVGTISKAAEQLHVTQPTLSRQLRDLEQQLGTPLFIRSKRTMTLTAAGVLFQDRARQVTRLISKAEEELKNQGAQLAGTLAIGCVESSVAQVLTEKITQMHATYPQVKFELYDGDGDDIKQKLDQGTLDLGVVLTPVETAKYNDCVIACDDNWGIIVPVTDPLAQKNMINPIELSSLPLIVPRRHIVQSEISDWLQVPAEKLKIVGSQNLLSNAILLTRAGFGYALCARGAFENRAVTDIKFMPLTPKQTIAHRLIWRKNIVMTPLIKAFISLFDDEVPKNVK